MANLMLTYIIKINNIKMINIDYVNCLELKPRQDIQGKTLCPLTLFRISGADL